MSLIHDPAQPLAFQPRPGGPVYQLRVPVVADRAAFRHALAAAQARYWSQLALARTARDAVVRLLAGLVEQGEWLERIDRYVAGIEAVVEAGGAGPEADRALAEAIAVPAELALILDALAGLDPVLAGRIADNQVFPERAGLVAARLFLVGWEGPGLPELRRGLAGVPDELLGHIPTHDLVAIGLRIGELLEPSRAGLGNSALRSSGPPGPSGSAAGPATRRKHRSRAGTAPV